MSEANPAPGKSIAQLYHEGFVTMHTRADLLIKTEMAYQLFTAWLEQVNALGDQENIPKPQNGSVLATQVGRGCLIAVTISAGDVAQWYPHALDTTSVAENYFIGGSIDPLPTRGSSQDPSLNACQAGLIRVNGLDRQGDAPVRPYQLLLDHRELGSLAEIKLGDIPPEQRFYPFTEDGQLAFEDI